MQAIIREPTSADGQRVMSMDQRPNLLIIDEIDGVSSSGGAEVNINIKRVNHDFY
jgi:chromosome transmission fidelity protein 18